MFTKAIVRRPCQEMVDGLTTANLGKPDYKKAIHQHNQYIKVLMSCGLDVIILEPDCRFPDSTFVEDTALLTPLCAIITYPGAPSRRAEAEKIAAIIGKYYDSIEVIEPPGTVEAGDIMMVRSHYYIGLSSRTNQSGADQIIKILNKYDMDGSTIALREALHLKSGVAYLENGNLLAVGEFLEEKQFKNFNILPVDSSEVYAANSIWVNDFVIMPSGNPKTKLMVENAGYNLIEVNISEFQKLDGGVSCLSLRF